MPIAFVTCGPACEPIDSVRCLTNRSTGELGTLLANELAAAGYDVVCFRGEMASHPPPSGARVVGFFTNVSLRDALQKAEKPAVIFHAAALCDYEVAGIEGAAAAAKIRSDAPELRLVLRPAGKILPTLRGMFPGAAIIGWKFELDGRRADAVARGRAQIVACDTDACVVNGAAYGAGFGFLARGAEGAEHFSDKRALCAALARRAEFIRH